MFHIVFCGDEKYFKYIAVCITSIVKNIIPSKSFDFFLNGVANEEKNKIQETFKIQESAQEKFIFHIMNNIVSETTLTKIKNIESELNKIVPVEIIIHELDDNIFLGQPLFRKSYLPYYRLKLADFMPKDLEKVLYLDGDTLVNCDIRELFAVDIDGHIAATINGLAPAKYALKKRTKGEPYCFKREYYFNSGVMLINLKQWKLHNISEETFVFLNTYIGKYPDQDALNVVIKENVVKLPYKWNVMIHGKYPPSESITMDESKHYNTQHTRADFMEGIENPKIIHYGRKPWMTNGFYVTANFKPYHIPHFDLWWDIATQTPIFKKELEDIKQSKKYRNMVKKNNRIEKGIEKNSLLFLLFKFKRTVRPFMAKLEKPFKKLRKHIQCRKTNS